MADTTISQLQSIAATGNTIVPVSLGGTTYQTPASSIVDTIGSRNSSITLPAGTLEQRPDSPTTGSIRYNTTNSILEFYDGNKWNAVTLVPSYAAVPISSVTSGWSFPVDQPTGLTINNGNYYGGRLGFINGDGTSAISSNNYEWPIFSVYSVRNDPNKETILQLYGFGGTASSFTQAVGNESFFQMGFVWTYPTNLYQSNSLKARGELASGNGVYFCNRGVGNNTLWSFYNGGGNNNSASGSNGNNLESSVNVSWATNQTVSIVIKADNRITNSRRIGVFVGDSLVYKFNQFVPLSQTNIYFYVGIGYPTTAPNSWNAASPKFRYIASETLNISGF